MDFDPPHVVYDASVLFPYQTVHIPALVAIVGAVRARWPRTFRYHPTGGDPSDRAIEKSGSEPHAAMDQTGAASTISRILENA